MKKKTKKKVMKGEHPNMTPALAKYEKSAADKKMDKASGFKEGSKSDLALDKLMMKIKSAGKKTKRK